MAGSPMQWKSDHYRAACYVALEIANLMRQAASRVERHINCSATFDAGIPLVRICGGARGATYPAPKAAVRPSVELQAGSPQLAGSWPI
jgi:hypothetical protein